MTGKIDIQGLGPKGAVPAHGEQLDKWPVLYTGPFLAMKHELCISSLGHTCCRRLMVRSPILELSWLFALQGHNPCMKIALGMSVLIIVISVLGGVVLKLTCNLCF